MKSYTENTCIPSEMVVHRTLALPASLSSSADICARMDMVLERLVSKEVSGFWIKPREEINDEVYYVHVVKTSFLFS
jgi:hypothetical protein